jgi:hypothetical protein
MSVRGDIRDDIVAKLAAAIPEAYVVGGWDESQSSIARKPLLIAVMWRSTDYDPNQEYGAVRQLERWTWDIYVVVATTAAQDSGWETLDTTLATIRATLCPAAGYRAGGRADCEEFNLLEEFYEGIAQVGRAMRATYTHGRFAG